MKYIKPFNEAVKTKCQTPDTQFHTEIKDKKISIDIDLPMDLDLSEEEAELLDANIHFSSSTFINAMELVLAPYLK